MIETNISYPKLIVKESVLVIKPQLESNSYWLFDTLWKYGSGINYIHLYSTISGYGSKINNNKSFGIIHIKESMGSRNLEFLNQNQINQICEKTKYFFKNSMLNHHINVDFEKNILIDSFK